MTRPELSRLIKYGESQTVSLKALRTKPSTLARPMVSFSNTNDGLLIVGIDDKTRKIYGAKTTKQREERLGMGTAIFYRKSILRCVFECYFIE